MGAPARRTRPPAPPTLRAMLELARLFGVLILGALAIYVVLEVARAIV